MMKNFWNLTIFFAVLFLIPVFPIFSQALAGPADGELAAIVDSIDAAPNEVTRINLEQFFRFLDYAEAHQRNLFELLNLVYPLLVERDLRYEISGSTIQDSERHYNIGGEKVRIILPIDSVIKIEIGKSNKPQQHALDVFIEEYYSADFYGFGILHEETHFGFETITLNYFKDAFGMYAKRLFFSFDVSHLHLYETEEIAIHLKNFFKPKREVFKAVRSLNK